jgi:hypothetical protein
MDPKNVLKDNYREAPPASNGRAAWTSSSLANIDSQPLPMIAGSQNNIGIVDLLHP